MYLVYMSLEIEINNEPVLLPGRKPRAKRRVFMNKEERINAYSEYRKQYYQDHVKGKVSKKSILIYYKRRYNIPMTLVYELEEQSRETLINYCSAKGALDTLHKNHNSICKDLLEQYVDNKVSLTPQIL